MFVSILSVDVLGRNERRTCVGDLKKRRKNPKRISGALTDHVVTDILFSLRLIIESSLNSSTSAPVLCSARERLRL